MIESWKSIEGYDGLYEVSNLGRIKALPKYWKCGNRGTLRHSEEKILKTNICANGYMGVWLSNNSTAKNFYIHRLVALAFIHNEHSKPFVNHKDGIKTNNNETNLEWCNRSENTLHAFETGLMLPNKGQAHPGSKLKDSDVLAIRKLKGKYTQQQIADMFKIGRRAVGNILERKNWTHI